MALLEVVITLAIYSVFAREFASYAEEARGPGAPLVTFLALHHCRLQRSPTHPYSTLNAHNDSGVPNRRVS